MYSHLVIQLNQTATILKLRNTQYSLVVESFLYEDGTTRFKLTVPNHLNNYILYSDALAFQSTDMVCIWIRRVHDIYQLEILVDPDFTEENNIWYGQQMPGSGLEVYDSWIDAPNLFTYSVNREGMNIHASDSEPGETETDDLWI